MLANSREHNIYQWRKLKDKLFKGLFFTAIVISLAALAALLGGILMKGLPYLTLDFLSSYPSRFAAKAGIKSALAGTFAFILITGPTAFVVGVLTAV